MKILKDASVESMQEAMVQETALAAELELLNTQTKSPLGAQEVYLFAVRLCDNRVDRDGEFFDRACLEQLAPMFVGTSGIFDHDWTAKGQTARLYRTEVLSEAGLVSESTEAYCYLKGYAYMLKTEANADLIAEIEGGIKKEVSVSCAISRKLCSICGHEISDRLHCTHVKGQLYDEGLCALRLSDPTDAFEWSFVAVPAQRAAGVMKAFSMETEIEKAMESVDMSLELRAQLACLAKEAAYGRRCLDGLRADVLRLGLLARKEFSSEMLSKMLARLEEGELLEMRAAFAGDAAKRFPLAVQLSYGKEPPQAAREDGVFCI